MPIQHLEIVKQLISDQINISKNLWLIINLFNKIEIKIQHPNSI